MRRVVLSLSTLLSLFVFLPITHAQVAKPAFICLECTPPPPPPPPRKIIPTVTWATPGAVTYGTALSASQLDATASVAGTFSYSPGIGAVLPAGVQTLSVTFTPTSTLYSSVATSTTIQVNQATPIITWQPLSPVMSGSTLGETQLNASANVPGTFTYSPVNGTTLSTGIQSITATFTPSDTTDYAVANAANPLIVEPSAPSAPGSSVLSTNSGINALDTYAIVDVSAQSVGSVNMQTPTYSPLTQGVSSVAPANDIVRNFHMEVGYDGNGAPVLNIFPQSSGGNPATTSVGLISSIRYAGGQMSVFDSNGNPLSLALPNSSIPTGWPLNLPVLGGGTPVLGGLVVRDIQTYAQSRNLSLTLNGSQAVLVGTPSGGPAITWLYAQQGTVWILQAISMASQDATGTSARQVLFANLTRSVNRTNDEAREANGFVQPRPIAANAGPDGSTPTPQTPCGIACAGTYTLQNFGGPQNVLFQHGFLSSGSTWERMTGWLNQDFTFGNEVVTSLTATAPLSDQGENLENIIQQAGGNQYILIGHSQGGLISRYAAQYFQGSSTANNAVEGVITVDTPHLGADLTLTGPEAIGYGVEKLANSLYGDFGCVTPGDNYGCYISDLIYVGATELAQSALSQVGALNDLTPGSTFLTQLNAAPENFQRAAVIGETPQRWLVTRVIDNFVLAGPNPDDADGERNAAALTEVVYDIVYADLIFSTAEEIEWIDYCYFCGGIEYGDPYCDSDFSAEIAQDTAVLNTMDKIDSFYDGLIAPNGDGSDGFVQNTSQFYPSASAVQYTISGADSHLAATRSPYDHTALDYLLSSIYKIQAPAPCTFTSNTPLISIGVGAGTYLAPMSAGANCQWSATSNSPWITIDPSSVSGTGPASITFEVQALTGSTVPRSGTIQIGNASGNTTITVDQSASSSCTYQVNPVGCTTIYLGGGTVSAQVTTQASCVWSAGSNVSWATTQNGSGVGSGSFTINLAPAAAGIERQFGIIDVMGQTLSVGEEQFPPPSGICSAGGSPHQ